MFAYRFSASDSDFDANEIGSSSFRSAAPSPSLLASDCYGFIPVVELQVSVLCCSVYSVNKCFSFLNACSVDGVHSNTAFLDSRACSGAVFAEI